MGESVETQALSDIVLAERLRGVAAELGQLEHETERQFLAVGERLQEFVAQAEELGRLAAEATGVTGGAEQAVDLHALASLAQQAGPDLVAWREAIATGAQGLATTAVTLDSLRQTGDRLRRAGRRLAVLGLYTGIEAGRLPSDADHFAGFCQEIRELSDRVAREAAAFRRRVGSASSALTDAHAEVVAGAAACSQAIDRGSETLQCALGSLSEVLQRSEQSAAQMARAAEETSRRVAEVVMLLQFHDIARQRIQHIASALEGLAAEVDRASSCSGAGEMDAVWADAYGVLTVQEGQIAAVVGEAHHTAALVTTSLELIATESGTQAREMSQWGSGDDTSVLASLRSSLAAFAAQLGRALQLGEGIVGSTDEALTAARSLGAWAEQFGPISECIRLLGLNAVIMTARLGSDGQTLSVCADEACAVGAAAQQAIAEVVARLGEVRDQAIGLRERIGAGLAERSARQRELGGVLERSTADLAAMQARVARLAQEAGDRADRLAGEIAATSRGIRFDQDMERNLDRARQQLIEVRAARCPDGNGAVAGTHLEELGSRYTMAGERVVHGDVVRTLTGERPAGTEALWAAPGEAGPRDGGDDDLGDNVELF